MSFLDVASEVGQIRATIGLIVGILMSFCLIGISIMLFMRKDIKYLESIGKITELSCNEYIKNNQQYYKCILTIDYNIDEKNYKKVVETDGMNMYSLLSDVPIYYEDGKPELIILVKPINNKFFASILLGCGLCIGLFSMLNKYLVSKSNAYSTMTGMTTFLGK